MEKHTVAELKDMCRTRGLKVSGTKRDLITRLTTEVAGPVGTSAGTVATGDNAATTAAAAAEPGAPPAKRARTSAAGSAGTAKPTARNIGKLLEAVGMKSFSHCAASAITKGHLRWNRTAEELDQPAVLGSGALVEVHGEDYTDCWHTWNPTLRQLLEQTDYPGSDYEDGMDSATIRCPEKDCGGATYLTLMCTGAFKQDSGKFHNHCTECKGLGKCMGDYRMAHCQQCGRHYFQGNSGFECDRCAPNGDSDGFGGGGWDDDDY